MASDINRRSSFHSTMDARKISISKKHIGMFGFGGSFDPTIDERIITIDLAGNSVNCRLEIKKSCRTLINFDYNNRHYEFKITEWIGAGIYGLCETYHFFRYPRRNPEAYGTLELSIDDVHDFHITKTQRVNIIVQSAIQVMKCLNWLLTTHENSFESYAKWVCLKKELNGYDFNGYILLICCHQVIRNEFNIQQPNWEKFENWSESVESSSSDENL